VRVCVCVYVCVRVCVTQSHPKKSYNWRLGTSFDHALVFQNFNLNAHWLMYCHLRKLNWGPHVEKHIHVENVQFVQSMESPHKVRKPPRRGHSHNLTFSESSLKVIRSLYTSQGVGCASAFVFRQEMQAGVRTLWAMDGAYTNKAGLSINVSIVTVGLFILPSLSGRTGCWT